MLALFQISEANDLGMALGRLFLSGNPARERLASGRCFARYVVVEDPDTTPNSLHSPAKVDGLISPSRFRGD